ncbi:circadian clock KaiB family protein [Leptolyngbya sp. AN02str]|uniref:circadian clock KaiB family protein n=1 Tax=Leptolyngbya sp. AN02str TaxID=3423363 RepID=UPI003D31A80D
MNDSPIEPGKPTQSDLFKGIALFTPGGDVVYCIDPHKRTRWHLQLCAVLQEMLRLSEPPHFLVPCYTATIDRWIDSQTQQLRTSAEAHPLVLYHQALLNAMFGTGDLQWQAMPALSEICEPLMLTTYRKQFPELWENHDLVMQFETLEPQFSSRANDGSSTLAWSPNSTTRDAQGYVLRLYISGNSGMTEEALKQLHELLEQSLRQPYTLKVVDIHKTPEEAEADQVTATPTLIKVYPPPVRRLVGDLESLGKMLKVLSYPGV